MFAILIEGKKEIEDEHGEARVGRSLIGCGYAMLVVLHQHTQVRNTSDEYNETYQSHRRTRAGQAAVMMDLVRASSKRLRWLKQCPDTF